MPHFVVRIRPVVIKAENEMAAAIQFRALITNTIQSEPLLVDVEPFDPETVDWQPMPEEGKDN